MFFIIGYFAKQNQEFFFLVDWNAAAGIDTTNRDNKRFVIAVACTWLFRWATCVFY